MKKHKQRKISNMVLTHIKINAKEYIILAIALIIGLIIGILFVNRTSDLNKQEITSYLETFIKTIKESKQINYASLLKDSIVKNLLFAGILWFMGIAVTLAPLTYGVIGFRGFCLGYTISSAIAILGVGKGIIFAVTTLLLQNILQIPAMLAIAQSSLHTNKKLLKQSKDVKIKHERKDVKFEMIRHSIFSLLMTGALIASSLLETYVSSSLFIWGLQYI